jgi:hypothetical protein
MTTSNTILPDDGTSAAAFSTLLIPDSSVTSDLPVGLIIIPAGRSNENLSHGLQLAQESGATLVVLASHDTSPHRVNAYMANNRVRGIAIGLPNDYILPLTADFNTNRHKHKLMIFKASSNCELHKISL